MKNEVYEALSPTGRAALSDERDRLQERLAKLREEHVERQAALAKVDGMISRCIAAMDALSHLLRADQDVQTSTVPPDVSDFRVPGDSIIAAVSAVFSEHGNQPLHYRELTSLVAERGVLMGGKDPAATLLSILTNARYTNRFERCARGTYRPVNSEADMPIAKPRKSRRRRRVKRSNA